MGITINKLSAPMTVCSLALIGGCYPMEQASLVYASRHQVGVSVSAGTAESPGLDLSLGYKGQDIAMVPVAVAKFCEIARQADCTREIYKMQVIAGGRQETTDNADLLRRIDALNGAADKNEAQRTANVKAITEFETQLARYNNLTALKKRIAEIDSALAAPPVDDDLTKLSNEKAVKVQEIAAFSDVVDLDVTKVGNERAALTSANVNLEGLINRDRSEANRLVLQMRTGTAGRRDDALSVYGTFSGQTEGRSTEAKLSAGKVFATGVAAQNLSETAGAANCLAAIAVLAEKVNDKTIRDQLISRSQLLCDHKPSGT